MLVAFPRFSFVLFLIFPLPFVHMKRRDTSTGLLESPCTPRHAGRVFYHQHSIGVDLGSPSCWLLLDLDGVPLYIRSYTFRPVNALIIGGALF